MRGKQLVARRSGRVDRQSGPPMAVFSRWRSLLEAFAGSARQGHYRHIFDDSLEDSRRRRRRITPTPAATVRRKKIAHRPKTGGAAFTAPSSSLRFTTADQPVSRVSATAETLARRDRADLV